jgi:hypothetical protein
MLIVYFNNFIKKFTKILQFKKYNWHMLTLLCEDVFSVFIFHYIFALSVWGLRCGLNWAGTIAGIANPSVRIVWAWKLARL